MMDKSVCRVFQAFICLLFLYACKPNPEFENKEFIYSRDLSDPNVQCILRNADRRQLDSILTYKTSSDPKIIYELALVSASLQEEELNSLLVQKLGDLQYPKVRSAIYFACGQALSQNDLEELKPYLELEEDSMALNFLKEAIGKQGLGDDLYYLLSQGSGREDVGMLRAIYRFSQRNILTSSAVEYATAALKWKSTESRRIASNFLGRIDYQELMKYQELLAHALRNDPDQFVRANVATAFNKLQGKQSAVLLMDIARDSSEFFGLRVNAINSLNYYHYESVAPMIMSLIYDSELKVKKEAIQFFLNRCKREEWKLITKRILKEEDPQISAGLLAISLKHARNDEKAAITSRIKASLRNSKDDYVKSELLKALAQDPNNYIDFNPYIFGPYSRVVNSNAMASFYQLSKKDAFNGIDAVKQSESKEVIRFFAETFRQAVLSGESTLMGYGARGLRNKEIDFGSKIKDTEFLLLAIQNLDLPEQVETQIELKKTISFLEGKEYSNEAPPLNNFLSILELEENRQLKRATVHTNKGSFELELFSDLCPATVNNFIKLSQSSFYDTLRLHRVENHFVAQFGCPQGDGWGSSGKSIRSEFSSVYFEQGSVGMASAGKDTESCQWFVTHYPSHHLDGNYTNFGRVVKGMPVVYSLNIGDTLLGIDIK